MTRLLTLLTLLLLFGFSAGATVQAFVGATLIPITAEPIEEGVLIVEGGHILEIGKSSTPIPEGAEVIDFTGKVILPGLVDTHSHLGRVSGGDQSSPLHPGTRALDSVDIFHSSFVRALAGGITTVNVMPGSGFLMSGQTIFLKIRREGSRVEDWLLCREDFPSVCGGMKMANGTNPMGPSPFSGTRAKSAALVRQLFLDAQEFRGQVEEARKEKKPIPRDLGKEVLVEVLKGQRRVHFHTHRHDDIATVLRLAREFGFQPVIQHGSEAWMLGREIAEAGLVVSMTLVDSPGGKEEISAFRLDAPALLDDAEVAVALNTDDLIDDSRWFLRNAALAIRFGFDRQRALEAVTIVGARALDLDHRVGSLEVGKDADLIVLSGDPFALDTMIEQTFVEGRKVFDLEDPGDQAIAVGGWGVLTQGGRHHE